MFNLCHTSPPIYLIKNKCMSYDKKMEPFINGATKTMIQGNCKHKYVIDHTLTSYPPATVYICIHCGQTRAKQEAGERTYTDQELDKI